ncbi:cAMP-dependent protein kinase catalytic subunit [Dispira parvispora]|uniref:cAMP-dependent protein kinase catalytic subunit n=1 Tax=Dispira parvispora TaxID=1520584 RepID=A0A9W8E0J6_9FUNG|nr:cAMP-dependent protein kinase catalytic subunit [Dispira parvispora]
MSATNLNTVAPSEDCMIGMVLHDKERQFKIYETIGQGTYGPIYLAQLQSSPFTKVAVKCLNKAPKSSGNGQYRDMEFHRLEMAIQMLLNGHQNIVGLEFAIDTEKCLFLGMEYCSYGDLYEAITTDTSVSHPWHGLTTDQPLIKRAFLDILSSVAYCHERGIFHRDLKPENIFVGADGRLKLADFGLATTDFWSSEFGCGSSFYMSPETQDKYFGAGRKCFTYYNEKGLPVYCTAACDIWSLGVIFLNLCFGRNPWKNANHCDPTFAAFMRNPRVLMDMFPLTDEAFRVLTRVFALDPAERCTIHELIRDVQGINQFFKEKSAPAAANRAAPSAPSKAPGVETVSRSNTLTGDSEQDMDVTPSVVQNVEQPSPKASSIKSTSPTFEKPQPAKLAKPFPALLRQPLFKSSNRPYSLSDIDFNNTINEFTLPPFQQHHQA